MPHQNLPQSCIRFCCRRNVQNQQFWFIDRISGITVRLGSITWVDDFVLNLAVLRVSPSIIFKQLNQLKIEHLYIGVDDPMPLMWFTVRPTLWCNWWNTLEREKNWKFAYIHPNLILCPPELTPTNVQYVSCYASSDSSRLFTGLLPGSKAGWGCFPSDHQITTASRMTSPAWIPSKAIPLYRYQVSEPSFRHGPLVLLTSLDVTLEIVYILLTQADGPRKNIPLSSCSSHSCHRGGLQLRQWHHPGLLELGNVAEFDLQHDDLTDRGPKCWIGEPDAVAQVWAACPVLWHDSTGNR